MKMTRVCSLDDQGREHSDSGPAVVYKNGDKAWYNHGKRHREDGPAFEWENGSKAWYVNDILHRLDGPAEIWHDGHVEWWINGYHVTKIIHQWANERDIDLNNLSDIDKAVIALEWGNYNG
jgi:hypothetical protein